MKIENMLGKIFIVLISILATFLLIDYLSTWFINSRSPIEKRFPGNSVRLPKPYTMFGGKGQVLDLNPLGYRGKAPLIPKGDSEFRVVMLGGSTVFNGEPPIAELLEDEFFENGQTDVKVYNFGVISSVSGMELARVVFELPEFKPDLVIFYNGGNDILHPWFWDPRPGFPFNFIAYESNPLIESDVREYPTIAMIAYGSNLARYFFPHYFIEKFTKLSELRKEVGWKNDEWKEAIAVIYIDNLVKADIISRGFGAKFIAFFQPMMFSKNKLSDQEKLKFNMSMKEYVLNVQGRIRNKIKVLGQKRPLIVDVSGIYDKDLEDVFADMIHTRQSAKRAIVKKMYAELINNKVVKSNADTHDKPSP